MTLPDPNSQTEPRPVHWPSLLQAVFSFLGMLAFWSLAVGTIGVGERMRGLAPTESISAVTLAAGLGFCGVVAGISGALAVIRLGGVPLPKWAIPSRSATTIRLALLLVIAPSSWFLGSISSKIPLFRWAILPIVNIALVVIPIGWFLSLGGYRLPGGSSQRRWGALGAGMAISSSLSLGFELLAGIGLLVIVVVFIISRPEIFSQLTKISAEIQQPGAAAQEELAGLVQKYLASPAVLAVVGGFLTVFAPLLEEALKPMGVWLLSRRRLQPVDGFTLGMLGGAGFALLESLTFAANAPDTWEIIVLVRAGTSLMHILTSGLVGWGLVEARCHGRFGRLAGAFLAAVCIHGLWNGTTVGVSILALTNGISINDLPAIQVGVAAGLSVGLLTALIGFNAYLRRAIMSHSEVESPSQSQNISTFVEETHHGRPDQTAG